MIPRDPLHLCNLNHSSREASRPTFSTTGQTTRGKIATGGWIYICLAAVHRRNIHGLRAISGFVRRGGSSGRRRGRGRRRERKRERGRGREKKKKKGKREKIEKGK